MLDEDPLNTKRKVQTWWCRVRGLIYTTSNQDAIFVEYTVHAANLDDLKKKKPAMGKILSVIIITCFLGLVLLSKNIVIGTPTHTNFQGDEVLR